MKRKKAVSVTLAIALISCALLFAAGLVACDLEQTSEVVMIGDSLLDMSGCIPGLKMIRHELEALSHHRYRSYDVSGALLDSDDASPPMAIPVQYENAKAENPDIETIILNGGANDILGHPVPCLDKRFGEECMELIEAVSLRMEALIGDMIEDGVKNIIYVSYLDGGGFDLFNTATAYSTEKARQLLLKLDGVNGVKIKMVDAKPYQQEHPEINWLCIDHTHPTMDASEYIADLIWETMVANDMTR